MNDVEIRIACVQAAVQTTGNPNHVQQARAYYDFVTEGNSPAATEEVTTQDETDEAPQRGRKGARK